MKAFMSKTVYTTILSVIFVAFGLTSAVRADVIETKDGSRIIGKLTKIAAGKLYVTTAAAGDIMITQSQVVSITTDHPLAIRLESNTRADGTIATENGALRITAPEGTIVTPIEKISQSWPIGGLDPIAAHWTYEATLDINGTTGNKNQLGTDAGFSAKRIAPKDQLDFYAAYNRQVTEGAVSADQFKAGIDYTSDFNTRGSWFVRDEAGFDKVMEIQFYETAAAGVGQDLIKNKFDTLTARVGVAYRYDGYEPAADTATVSSAALDLELAHDLKTSTWELVDKLVVLPEFNDFSNLMVTQDSYFQIPLLNPAWKLRIGLSNNYDSKPPPGIKNLDTTYYTRLILDWGQ